MTHDEIQKLITDGLVDTFQLDRSSITLDARLYEDLDLDSIDSVDLAAKLQSETGIRLAPQGFKLVSTVGDLVAALHGSLEGLGADVQSAAMSVSIDAERRDERQGDDGIS